MARPFEWDVRRPEAGWAAGRGSFSVGDQRAAVRLTAVFHQENGAWKVVRMHASIGVPNDRMFDPLLQARRRRTVTRPDAPAAGVGIGGSRR